MIEPASSTRFAPAPTGYLHLGHLANAIWVWGGARAAGADVILRIEDHDRQRCRPEYETALLEDLERLGLEPDEPSIAGIRAGPSPFRQSDCGEVYQVALSRLESSGLAYGCDCARSTFADWATRHGSPWSGPGCPGECRRRDPEVRRGIGVRIAVGEGEEAWEDVALGPRSGPLSAGGDLLARDRHGNWTYAFCVVVDDLRHGVDLVIRGVDLADATPPQIRLGRLLGRPAPPTFLHHPLVRKASGAKLSKADADRSVRSLLEGGATPETLFGQAALAVGLLSAPRSIRRVDFAELVVAALERHRTEAR